MTTALISLMLMIAPIHYKWCTPELYQYTQYYAQVNHLSPALVRAVIHAESSGNPFAVSRCGAIGLMQVMPVHEPRYTLALFDAEYNIRRGCQILAYYMRLAKGNTKLALHFYNAGPHYLKYHTQWPKSTIRYVAKIFRDMGAGG